jgi:hypothetical protein
MQPVGPLGKEGTQLLGRGPADGEECVDDRDEPCCRGSVARRSSRGQVPGRLRLDEPVAALCQGDEGLAGRAEVVAG